ncbi:class I SAM-dependent methyltransferase [Candidatus Woesearchaeota archaeon]|nr:MAG: class I SAM-dependent methyltransferase [Candidatus Woesearchaeota archaeon]
MPDTHISSAGFEAGMAREKDSYYESAASYDALHKEEQVAKISLILQHLPIATHERLLDVGCGTGFSLDYWPCDAYGAEPSLAMIRQAPQRLQERIFHVRAEDLSIFHDDEFDIVVSITAIHHFAGLEDGLKELRRVGRGRFAFSVLRKSHRFSLIEKTIRQLFRVERVLEDNPHDSIFLCRKG